MPQDFNNCVKNKGKVVTKKLKNGRYLRICYGKNGKSYTNDSRVVKKTGAYYNDKKRVKNSVVLAEDLLRLKQHFDEQSLSRNF